MAELRFNPIDVAALLRDSAAAGDRRPTFDQQIARMGKANGLSDEAAMDAAMGRTPLDSSAGGDIPPGLWLVKDDGIYLMSNAELQGEPKVVYAQGYDPKSGDVWEKSRDAVGGDDMCEFVPADAFADVTAENCVAAVVRVTPNALSFGILQGTRQPGPRRRDFGPKHF
ncbi:MAG: DUF3085 domain-containing protein [Candidatus Dormibacteria bacterium]